MVARDWKVCLLKVRDAACRKGVVQESSEDPFKSGERVEERES